MRHLLRVASAPGPARRGAPACSASRCCT